MTVSLHPLDFAQMSDIRVAFSGAKLRPDGRCDILIASFSGVYRVGYEGKADARLIHALGQAGVIAWDPDGVILDFSELDYQWGDNLRDILDIGEQEFGIEGLPQAIVVGPRCERAVRSLFAWPGPGRSESSEWIFSDFEQAWNYIEAEIADCHARYGSIMRPPFSPNS